MSRIDGQSVRESLRAQLWPVPLAAVLLALVLGQFLPFIDEQLDTTMPSIVSGLLFGGGPEAARSLLETVASSTITVTSLTFSLTVVTLQLASSQFSPRLLRTFTRDRFVHNTLALFLATFVFALTVLRSIRVETSAGAGFVPEIAVTTAFLLTIASVIGLVLFLAHLARQIRVETMMRDVHREAERTLQRIYPERDVLTEAQTTKGSSQTTEGLPLEAPSSGFLTRVNGETLTDVAADQDLFVRVDAIPGDSIIKGLPIARAWSTSTVPLDGERLDSVTKDLIAAFKTGFERTSNQDPTFGLQQLLDVADKALSPGVNDPTTAVHALSHISAILCALTDRRIGSRILPDNEATPRVELTLPAFSDLLELVMDQLITYAFTDPRTSARTIDMLTEITTSAAYTGLLGNISDSLNTQTERARTAIKQAPLDEAIKQNLTEKLAT